MPVEGPASGESGASAAADPWGADSGATGTALQDHTRTSAWGNAGTGDPAYAAALKALEGTQEKARSAPTQGDGNYVSALKELEERAASILREAQQAVDETFGNADTDEAETSPGWIVDDREDDALAKLEAERAHEERRRRSEALVERNLAIAAAVQTLNREVNTCHTHWADYLRGGLAECETAQCFGSVGQDELAECRRDEVAKCRNSVKRNAESGRLQCEEDARSTYQRTIGALVASP